LDSDPEVTTMTAAPSIYEGKIRLSCKETAVLVREALKKAFPETKFSVRSKTYSGGASIDVSWTDGPTSKSVNKVIKPFEGSDFDAMIDLKTYCDHWLLPDGTVQIAHREGTTGSLSEIITDPPAPNAQLVSFGADYVFGQRRESPEFLDAVLKVFEAKLGRELPREPREQWNLEVPLKVDRLDGTLYHMVETETECLGTVLNAYVDWLTGEEVLTA